MTAHLTKVKDGYALAISQTVRAADAHLIFRVLNKRIAREVAAKHGAKPWNF
jgi:hypothetical protein